MCLDPYTPYNKVADKINQKELEKLHTRQKIYDSDKSGIFKEPNADTPAPNILKLKVGAMIIFNKSTDFCFNGQGGTVVEFTKAINPKTEREEEVIIVEIASGAKITAYRETWLSYSYTFDENTDEIIQVEDGRFIQFPIQLGWAITIHKSQGRTLESIKIDFDNKKPFTTGLLYVALSRVRHSKDMHLISDIQTGWIFNDERILNFLY